MKYLIFLFLFGFIWLASSIGYAVNQPLVACNQQYALCSAAQCIPDPHDSNYAICNCRSLNGNSLGHSSCEARKPVVDQNKVLHIISTFSLANEQNNKGLECASGNVWTNCLDQPCTVNPLNPQQAICSCPMVSKGNFVTFGGSCDKNLCATGFWSAALASDVDDLLKAIKNPMPTRNLMCLNSNT